MKHLIDKDALVAEIEKLLRKDKYSTEYVNGKKYALKKILTFIDSLEEKDVDYSCDENRGKELALSLQIQAYLNTVSDELYAQGKPLYSKSHLDGIHECMKMWVKLHNYYFYKHTCENKEVDLEKEFDNYTKDISACDIQFEPFTQLKKCAKYFYELGLKAKEE